jgi:hypothetical protein
VPALDNGVRPRILHPEYLKARGAISLQTYSFPTLRGSKLRRKSFPQSAWGELLRDGDGIRNALLLTKNVVLLIYQEG